MARAHIAMSIHRTIAAHRIAVIVAAHHTHVVARSALKIFHLTYVILIFLITFLYHEKTFI